MTMRSPRKNSSRDPVDKVLTALHWLISDAPDDVGVREMASALGVAPSTAHRLLASLTTAGFVRQDAATGRYALGLELFRLGQIAASRAPIIETSLRHMRTLVDACNETAVLGLYERTRQQMMFAASVESTNMLRYALELNKWMPVYAGASGTAIMAFLPEQEQDAIIARTKLMALTERTISEPYRLKHELAQIRERGYALTSGQRIRGAIGLAAPVFWPSGDIVGDICLTIPEQRFDGKTEEPLVRLLVECTSAISRELVGGGRR